MKIAFLTAGGIAPCLSSSIGALIDQYAKREPEAKMIGYLNGYRGLLLGKSIDFPESVKSNFSALYEFGGSPIGNSRVKLTNIQDCIDRGYVSEGEAPLKVAADQLKKDNIDILHTIGGDDTNTMAAQLSNYLKENNLLNLKIDKAISKTLQDGKKARRKDAIHFYDNFSSKSLRNYMYPPDVKPNARYKPFTFNESELSGTSLKIKSEPKFNLKNNKADKNWGYGIIEQDRFELTLKKNPRSIEDKPVWIGFRILEGEEFKTHPKARTNIFQIKQHSFGKITSLTVGHKETGGISHKIGHFYQNPNNWKVRKSVKEISASSSTLEPASKYPFSLFINKKHFERSYRKNPDGLPWVSSKNCEIGTV